MSRTLHTCTQPSCLTVATSHGGVGRGGNIPRWQRAQDLLSSVNLIFACKYDQDENCARHRYLSGWWWVNLNLFNCRLFIPNEQTGVQLYIYASCYLDMCLCVSCVRGFIELFTPLSLLSHSCLPIPQPRRLTSDKLFINDPLNMSLFTFLLTLSHFAFCVSYRKLNRGEDK